MLTEEENCNYLMHLANCKYAKLIRMDIKLRYGGIISQKKIKMNRTKCFQNLSASAELPSLQDTGVESPHRVASTSVGRFSSSFLRAEIL